MGSKITAMYMTANNTKTAWSTCVILARIVPTKWRRNRLDRSKRNIM
jgi:hypothetical protein